MSLNKIELKPVLLAELFASSLVETGTSTVPGKKEPEPKFLGKNGRHILIIVSHKEIPFLPDHELHFLTNILSACRLSLADIAIVNSAQTNEEELLRFIADQARHTLLFGISPLQIGLPINFPEFQLQKFDQCTYLAAPGLTEVEKDKNLKLRLWNALKTLFEI